MSAGGQPLAATPSCKERAVGTLLAPNSTRCCFLVSIFHPLMHHPVMVHCRVHPHLAKQRGGLEISVAPVAETDRHPLLWAAPTCQEQVANGHVLPVVFAFLKHPAQTRQGRMGLEGKGWAEVWRLLSGRPRPYCGVHPSRLQNGNPRPRARAGKL